MEGIKQEIPVIKTEPPTNDNIVEDDEFEDDNDLIIPPHDSQGQAWLVKCPKDLWSAWKQVFDSADDAPIEIGKLRLWDKNGSEDPLKMKAKIILNTDVAQQKKLPDTYDLKIRASGYANTVVFSEKDLPNHVRKQPLKSEAGKPQGLQSKNDRYGRNVKPGGYRTVIPKQTALAPLIQNEAVIQATEEATFASLALKWKEHLKPKVTTEISHSIDRRRLNAPSNFSAFSNFVKSSTPASKAAAQKKKAPKEKAVRMDHQDLLDALFQCFREYRYWPMRALRARLKQPEAYIKGALEQIAFLAKSGTFNLTWQLKPEFRAEVDQSAAKEEIKEEEVEDVPEGSGEDDTGVGSDDDDAGEFEDVKMEG